ncbi:glutathione S-transferase D4-like [Schistocerca gregaria]|uniref:glutathione S-transferase D4-like n=1 Tax=Schistocerca gregaria TaxID=7010 RepID=UPI00211F106C|nr:glutathione S-transferase D4-like [Schistocerca gregaria]
MNKPPSKKAKLLEKLTKPRLYHVPGYCSEIICNIIHILGIEEKIEIVDVDAETIKTPEYLSLNPHGTVPLFCHDDQNMVESGAIGIYIAHKYQNNKKLLPMEHFAEALQWVFYTIVTLYESVTRPVMLCKGFFKDKIGCEPNFELVKARWEDLVAPFIEKSLGNSTFILGNELSLPDLYLYNKLAYLRANDFFKNHPTIEKYYTNVEKRIAELKSEKH